MDCLRSLNIRSRYGIRNNLLTEFYIPTLRCAVRYDRGSAYFNSHGLAAVAEGLTYFIFGGGSIRLLVSPENWDREDVRALHGHKEVPPELARRLAAEMVPASELEAYRLSVLSWMVKAGRLEVRILAHPNGSRYHQKIGVMTDCTGNQVAFSGSANETLGGWDDNAENLTTHRSWGEGRERSALKDQIQEFLDLWEGRTVFRAIPISLAVLKMILPPAHADPPTSEEPPAFPHPWPVQLFDYQLDGMEYLVEAFPNSRLLADEVGLGKTVTAAAGLMRLRKLGKCRRALILAPANVCVQWQEELAEKFELDCARLDGAAFVWADGRRSTVGGVNPFNVHELLIASSHLVRRPEWKAKLDQGQPFDLVILDEAHHARRKSPESSLKSRRGKNPNQLLALLETTLREQSACLWLLTATPIQLHLVEFFDLLCTLRPVDEPENSPLSNWLLFEAFYQALSSPDIKRRWDQLAWGVQGMDVCRDLLKGIGPADQRRIRQFGDIDRDATLIAEQMQSAGLGPLLLESVRLRSPGARFMLRRTRQDANLQYLFADRHPVKTEIDFTSPEEEALYRELDDFLRRLWQERHGKPKGYGMVLSLYRKRLASSWYALDRTIQRALSMPNGTVDEVDLLEMGWDQANEDMRASALSERPPGLSNSSWAELCGFANRVSEMVQLPDDPKVEQLLSDMAHVRLEGRSLLVFTQFWDTLEALRTALVGRYRKEVACYSGYGAQMWENECWLDVSKATLIDAFNQREISILLCTDAASEGLNLQQASILVNYDLPWNPMRVEQRIGRIDRIHQKAKRLEILNYVMRNTIESHIYDVLLKRIMNIQDVVGRIQPILGNIEETMAGAAAEDIPLLVEALSSEYANAGESIAAALR